MPNFLELPNEWLGFISAILGIISFFAPTNPQIIIDNSNKYYFPNEKSRNAQSTDFIYQYFLSRILGKRKNIKITYKKDIVWTTVLYICLFYLTINAQWLVSEAFAWLLR
ncbi:hypothetical protein VNN41_09780 [Lactococcus garvieae]|uniref:hypothetical protein n=1 Tax=Lactococcus garvieae TaxID=1363 RepID=UPI00324B1266